MFLPMFLPLLIMGFLVRPWVAIGIGFLMPLLSAILTGMPPLVPPIALVMSFEASAMAGTASLLYTRRRLPLWISLIAAILAGRAVLLAVVLGVAPLLKLPSAVFSLAALTAGLPGIALQIVIVPVAVRLLNGVRNGWRSS